MVSMLCSLWDDFSKWVSVDWSNTTYIIVVCVLGILGVMGLLSFLKGPKYNKDKKPFKWGTLVLSLLLFGILAIISCARFV